MGPEKANGGMENGGVGSGGRERKTGAGAGSFPPCPVSLAPAAHKRDKDADWLPSIQVCAAGAANQRIGQPWALREPLRLNVVAVRPRLD